MVFSNPAPTGQQTVQRLFEKHAEPKTQPTMDARFSPSIESNTLTSQSRTLLVKLLLMAGDQVYEWPEQM
jgi:hypothetical protein